MSRFPAYLATACALAYIAAGATFFIDPSNSVQPGSEAYWLILSQEHAGRLLFLAAFAATGLLAMGVIKPLADLLPKQTYALHWACCLGYLGYAVNTVGYVRLLGDEARRASAYVIGDTSAQQVISSFSLVLDVDGLLTFGAVGAFIASINVAALLQKAYPKWLALLGLMGALSYWVAWFGLMSGDMNLVALAASAGALGIGPIWWLGIAVQLWQRSHKA